MAPQLRWQSAALVHGDEQLIAAEPLPLLPLLLPAGRVPLLLPLLPRLPPLLLLPLLPPLPLLVVPLPPPLLLLSPPLAPVLSSPASVLSRPVPAPPSTPSQSVGAMLLAAHPTSATDTNSGKENAREGMVLRWPLELGVDRRIGNRGLN